MSNLAEKWKKMFKFNLSFNFTLLKFMVKKKKPYTINVLVDHMGNVPLCWSSCLLIITLLLWITLKHCCRLHTCVMVPLHSVTSGVVPTPTTDRLSSARVKNLGWFLGWRSFKEDGGIVMVWIQAPQIAQLVEHSTRDAEGPGSNLGLVTLVFI